MSNSSFEEQRPRLFALAYRMLGSVSDAEDVLQELALRVHQTHGIESLAAWCTTVGTNLCLDRLKEARRTREEYIGPWLPEPTFTTATIAEASSSEDKVSTTESISMAFLVLLESLSPLERAAFLLHEVFDLSFGEVAAVLDREEVACRKLHQRAKEHVRENRPRFEAHREAHSRLVAAFVQAVSAGDLQGLKATLAEDAVAITDGGGKLSAARKPIVGRELVALFFSNLAKNAKTLPSVEWHEFNAQPALILRQESELTVLIFAIEDETIKSIHAVRNPDKLRHLHPQQFS